MSKPTIGFIGLGLMGGNMVENLQKRGFKVVVMNRSQAPVDRVLARGNAVQASSARDLAEQSDIVQLCVTTSDVVESLVYGENGLMAGMKTGSVLIDFGTSIPASTQKIGADLAKKGIGMIDAPLGRTPAHAKDGLLNIMAAGDKATFDKYEPMLKEQGENVFYLGGLGAGQSIMRIKTSVILPKWSLIWGLNPWLLKPHLKAFKPQWMQEWAMAMFRKFSITS